MKVIECNPVYKDSFIQIRRVQKGDETALAFVQTESWKSAFGDFLDKTTLERCTNIQHVIAMYERLLDEKKEMAISLPLTAKHIVLHGGIVPVTRDGRCRRAYLHP